MELTPAQQPTLDKIAKKYHLTLVLLFGSRSRGSAQAKSDTDIAVLGTKRLSPGDLENALRQVLTGKIDLTDLNTATPLLGGRIMRDAKLLSGSPQDFARERIRFHVRYVDFNEFSKVFAKERLKIRRLA